MYIKKSIAMVASLVVLAGGYVAGAFIGIPNVDKTRSIIIWPEGDYCICCFARL